MKAAVEDLQERLGKAIANRRLKAGLSQESLGEIAALHRTYVGSVERGERNITIASLEAISRGLGCRPSELLREAGA